MFLTDNSLANFKSNTTSQNGEDGIINEIFTRIESTSKICIEFGAWDGKHLSNTWNLWANNHWSSILIEGDKKKYKTLEESVGRQKNVTVINRYVQPYGENSLDAILERQNITETIDLLSIDIDGNDYYIFEGIKKYYPRCIIIEFNSTIPPEIDYVQNPGEYMGCSARALVRLAESKGYELVACTDTNYFFVLKTEFAKLDINNVDLMRVFPYQYLTYVINS